MQAEVVGRTYKSQRKTILPKRYMNVVGVEPTSCTPVNSTVSRTPHMCDITQYTNTPYGGCNIGQHFDTTIIQCALEGPSLRVPCGVPLNGQYFPLPQVCADTFHCQVWCGQFPLPQVRAETVHCHLCPLTYFIAIIFCRCGSSTLLGMG
jgi:hypothetical protein